MSDRPGAEIAIDVQGPVRCEVFVLWLSQRGIEFTGPCGSAPWYIETAAAQPFKNLG